MKTRRRALPPPAEARLSNGIRVVLLERHDFPSTSAVLVLERGAAAAAHGVAGLYARSLEGASREYTKSEATEYLSFVGGRVAADASQDAVFLQVSALTPLFGSAVSRAAPMFVSPLLGDEDVDEARTWSAAHYDREREAPETIASEMLWATVFPSTHPYGSPVYDSPPRLSKSPNADARLRVAERATDRAVRAFRDDYLAVENVSIACAGDLAPDAMKRVLERAVAKLPLRRTTAPVLPAVSPSSARSALLLDRPGAVQTRVAVGWLGPRASDADALALEVLSAAMGGWLSSRLNLVIRKELGASYGVEMYSEALRDGGLIHVSAAIETERTVDALRGLLVELERLRTDALPESELAVAKLRSYYDLDQGTSQGLARLLASALGVGQPPAQVVTHNARVDAITSDQIRAAAAKWLPREHMRLIVIGDASRIAKGLRTLGIGDVEVTSAGP